MSIHSGRVTTRNDLPWSNSSPRAVFFFLFCFLLSQMYFLLSQITSIAGFNFQIKLSSWDSNFVLMIWRFPDLGKHSKEMAAGGFLNLMWGRLSRHRKKTEVGRGRENSWGQHGGPGQLLTGLCFVITKYQHLYPYRQRCKFACSHHASDVMTHPKIS